MQTFLEKAASHIFEKSNNGADLENIVVVLPTRRAVYFFKRALAQCADKPILSPEVVAIDDFISQRCGLQIADNVSLIFELFDVFKTVDANVGFEKFLQWASVLLKDFDQIDLYEIDHKYLFGYISEAKALERWSVEWPNSKVRIESATIQNQFQLFANLTIVYERFKAQLLAKNQAYRGLAYRTLAEKGLAAYEQQGTINNASPTSQFFYFVGFNALSSSEEKIIKTLVKAKRAECLWDTDFYYMRENKMAAGGELLRRYKDAGWSGEWKWVENQLLESEKQLHYYAVPNASMQTKVAGELYSEWLHTGQGGTDNRPVAIILADENLLLPMLFSLDNDVTDLNVTMGLGLKNSLLFTLIDSLFELQFTVAEFKSKEGKEFRIPKFNHRTIQKVLNHPFIRRYEFLKLQERETKKESIIQKTIHFIERHNLVYLDEKQLLEIGENHILFQILFKRWPNEPQKIIQNFYALIDELRDVYKDTQNAIETEYLFLFYTLLKQLESTLTGEKVEKLNLRTFRAFLYELIRQTRIPFNGEPLSALQVMGMLETRTLDFERIIILSMNEGVLPATKRQNSLIPFDIAREVGLPIYSDQDAVMSYHFFRLLQRASDIRLIHVTDPNTYNGGEESRFLKQLEYELVPMANQNITLTKHLVIFQPEGYVKMNEPIQEELGIPKNEETLSFIKKQLAEKGLYATHWNQYLSCSLQYYFNRVADVSEDEEVEERMGAAEFGSWIHKVLERIDQEYLMDGLDISEDEIKALMREEFDIQFKGYDAEAGINYLIYQTAEQTVINFLKKQFERNEGIEVLATEQQLSTMLDIELASGNIQVKIAGKIDRVELVKGMIRVIDYKTGKINNLSVNDKSRNPIPIDEILLESTKNGHEKVRQLWLYQYLVLKKMEAEGGLKLKERVFESIFYPVTAGFYSLREIEKGFIHNPLKFEDNITAEEYISITESYISRFIKERLLNIEEPFQKTIDTTICKFCDYKSICGR